MSAYCEEYVSEIFLRGYRVMSSTIITVKGVVSPLPEKGESGARVVIVTENELEYQITPRGAGADLDEEISAVVEATGMLTEQNGVNCLFVRSYTVLDEDLWPDDDQYDD